MKSSEWVRYFETNRRSLLAIPWHSGPELTAPERRAVALSLQEFQRGEDSEGRHLFHYAQQYVARTGDHDYMTALRFFIAEEQRHARTLGRFLTLNGIPLVKRTASDTVFRALRHLLRTLEVSIAVLITAEIIAQVYYAALQNATRSRILGQLCEQILRDEDRHVQFQSQQLRMLRAGRGRWLLALTMAAQRLLFFGTCLVVWSGHRRALRAGGHSFTRFWGAAWACFGAAFATLAAPTFSPVIQSAPSKRPSGRHAAEQGL